MIFPRRWPNVVLISFFLVAAIPVTVAILMQKTTPAPLASGIQNLNTGNQITHTNNPDGTMGLSSWQNNFSNSLPSSSLGNLTVLLANTTANTPILFNGNTITSLTLYVSKAEVQYAYQGEPVGSTFQSGTQIDKWEVLNSNLSAQNPLGIDIMKKNALPSLGLTTLGQGLYSEFRLYIDHVTVMLNSGKEEKLPLPGRSGIVRIIKSFSIQAGKTTNITITFNPTNSVSLGPNNTYVFNPVVSSFIVSQ